MLDYAALMQLPLPEARIEWAESDAMLHALAVGMGRDPESERALPYVYERDLKVLPTLPCVLEKRSAPERLGLMGIPLSNVLHLAQYIDVHSPLPPRGALRAVPAVTGAYAKGTNVVVLEEVALIDEATQARVATSRSTMMVREIESFGGGPAQPPPTHIVPDRAPDVQVRKDVRPEQAGIFRLLGDRNPLHIDPVAARRAGFDLPILHGMCTLGMAEACLLEGFPELGSENIRSFGANFANPVFPGDMLTLSFWRMDDEILFTADIQQRNKTVLRGGIARFS